jgi:hypothetical protein
MCGRTALIRLARVDEGGDAAAPGPGQPSIQRLLADLVVIIAYVACELDPTANSQGRRRWHELTRFGGLLQNRGDSRMVG